MKRIFIALLVLPLFVAAQNNTDDSIFIHKIAVNILSSDAAYNNLHYLTKNIGGRLSGSPQMYSAEQWGADAMKIAGADNVMLQECMVPHWVRGGSDKATIIYKDKNDNQQKYSLHILALGNSVGTGVDGIHAPLIRVNNFDDLESKKNELQRQNCFLQCAF